jgi:hypothetical protein
MLMFCICAVTFNCSKEENESITENSYNEVAKLFIENSKDVVINTEKVEQNYESFMNSLNSAQNRSNNDFTFYELSEMLEENFDIPKESMMQFFTISYNYRDLLSEDNARELLIAELENQVSQIDPSDTTTNESGRWLFATLHEIFADDDTHCSVQVLAHIVDAMVLTAAAAITAPTGVGAVVAGVGVASSVAAATAVASSCN